MLWNVRHLWLAVARFVFNSYFFASILLCRNNSDEALQMLTKEGQVQGNPLFMFLYGIGIILLIRKLKELHPEVVQPWYVDDSGALTEWFGLVLSYEDLLLYRPGFGYIPNPTSAR